MPLYSFFGPEYLDVNSQTAPYLTFMGVILPNNSYVDISLVGDSDSCGEGVRCHTDLTTCDQGMDCGDWYAPNGDKLALPRSGILNSTFERRESQKVTLYHRTIKDALYKTLSNSNLCTGIYTTYVTVTCIIILICDYKHCI